MRNHQQRMDEGTATESAISCGFKVHVYEGHFHRVPQDWRIPRCGVRDLWRQWWIGDTVKQVPPLRFFKTRDISHLDKQQLNKEELHRRTGRHSSKRRNAARTMCDLRYLMGVIQSKCGELNISMINITMNNVDIWFKNAANHLGPGVSDHQKSWTSVMRECRVGTSTKSGANLHVL